ncbi:hypothetical protein Plhal703r1_c36g0130781 [Plasmopara halstedii]
MTSFRRKAHYFKDSFVFFFEFQYCSIKPEICVRFSTGSHVASSLASPSHQILYWSFLRKRRC